MQSETSKSIESALALVGNLPKTRETSLVYTKLEEAAMRLQYFESKISDSGKD